MKVLHVEEKVTFSVLSQKTGDAGLCVRDTDFVSCFFCWLCYVGCRSHIAQEVEKAVYTCAYGNFYQYSVGT